MNEGSISERPGIYFVICPNYTKPEFINPGVSVNVLKEKKIFNNEYLKKNMLKILNFLNNLYCQKQYFLNSACSECLIENFFIRKNIFSFSMIYWLQLI